MLTGCHSSATGAEQPSWALTASLRKDTMWSGHRLAERVQPKGRQALLRHAANDTQGLALNPASGKPLP